MRRPGGDERTKGWPRGVLLGESGFVTSYLRLRRAASTHAVKCERGRLSSCDNTADTSQRR